MIADSFTELHAMADLLGLRRAWFQGDHYDLTPIKREVAIRLGALPVDMRAIVNKRRALRSIQR